MKILLVDDSEPFRQTIAQLLRAHGHEVIEAPNGLDGVKLARVHLPDVIVSDIVMSQVDGYAMTAVLRQHPTTADIPLVLMTGDADFKGMRRGMTLGADDYIAKPFKADELIAALELRVHRRQAARDEIEQKLACLGTGIGTGLPPELAEPLARLRDAAAQLTAPEHAALAQKIRTDARRVERLARNLFLHAQLELFGTNPAHFNALRHACTSDVGAIVSSQARQCADAAGRPGDLRLKIAPGSAAIAAPHLAKIVEELVGNAFQFSPVGTPVTVHCYGDGHGFLLTIHDQGHGLSGQPAPRPPGVPRLTGLGLPIARRLAELHGGKLLLSSEPGKGITVRVSLPDRPTETAVPGPK